MNFWLRLALLLAPREFRAYYGEQIAAGAREANFSDIFDIAVTGIRLRIEDIARDAAYAVRRLSKAPLFVAIVALTFALGIGANVAVFSVLNAVVLKPLPFLDPSGLVRISANDSRRTTHPAMSIPDIDDLRAQTHTLTAIAGVSGDQLTVVNNGRPFTLGGFDVMPEYFEILGIRPQLGRVLTPADSRPGLNNIVISDATWRKVYASDPTVIGREVALDSGKARVVGVLAPGQLLINPHYGDIGPQDFLSALPETVPPNQRGSRYLGAIARLAPGATIEAANAELALVSGRLQKLYPNDDKAFSFSAESLRSAVLGSAEAIVWTVFAAVIGTLLIACANVGNMLGARWSVRDREFALRRSLGATSSSVVRLLLIETGMLAVVGAVLGIVLAYVALRTIGTYALAALPRGSTVGIDGATMLYALGIILATTLLATIPPFMSLNVTDLHSMLKSAGRGGDASMQHRARSALVIVEIALALALVVLSGLMIRSFIELARTPLGVRANGVVVSEIGSLSSADSAKLSTRIALQKSLLSRLRALPGVDTAALTVTYPLGDMSLNFDTSVLGKTYPQGEEPTVAGNDVSSGYFRALGIPLLRGRDITDDDTASSAPVVVVNQSFARTELAGIDPLAAKIRIAGWNGTRAHWASVVGVVADTRMGLTESPVAQYYVPIQQAPAVFFSAVVHAPTVPPSVIGHEMQAAFAAVLPREQPPLTFTVDDRIALSTARVRMTATLLGALAAVALLIALAGIFGVVSFSVTQRSREFGVRMALGAGTPAIIEDVLRRTMLTTSIGVLAGLVVAALAARAIVAQLNSVSPFDPATFATVVLLIFLCAALAALQPAIRATRVEPVDALRYE